MAHWLTFDQDHEHLLRWEQKNLPDPNLIVRNLDNRRAHIHYAIESVCTSDAGRLKPIQYLAAIQQAYCLALDADPGYTGFITKNPLHPGWHVWELHNRVYSLGELADYVELQKKRWTRKHAANDAHHGLGRNCALFHRLRFWAYDHVKWHREQGSSYDHWMKVVLKECEQKNSFAQPLPYSEVKSTAKSVGKWVWTKYWPDGKPIRRGVMAESFQQSQLPLDLTTRQRLAARRTNQARREATEEKIINAIGELTAAGKRVSVAAISRLSGVSRQALYKDYPDLIKK